mmetsp:Transcript_35865/g.72837  ORF Transcript_35865/g.72837 Transcript_35865/m.72837 type:complete len:125 (-) Transcript_35865:135-509(-)
MVGGPSIRAALCSWSRLNVESMGTRESSCIGALETVSEVSAALGPPAAAVEATGSLRGEERRFATDPDILPCTLALCEGNGRRWTGLNEEFSDNQEVAPVTPNTSWSLAKQELCLSDSGQAIYL